MLYHLGVRRGEEMPYATLFDGFGFIGKLILLNIVITLYVFLWSMLLIIPGIIAGYRYRFAVYNLCENPDMGVMEAISMSKAQTAGYKGDLFLLDLTFIGWNLLCSLTLGILSIWIAPYIIQTNIGYFQEIKRIKGIGWQARPEQPDGPLRPGAVRPPYCIKLPQTTRRGDSCDRLRRSIKEPHPHGSDPQKSDKNKNKRPKRSESCTAQDSDRLVLI